MDRVSQREWVVKILFQIDFNKSKIEELETILTNHDLSKYEFIKSSLESILKNIDEIDKKIEGYLTKLPMNKISMLDKCILRTSINEFVFQKSVPTSVSINEAVEISKKYSNEDSYKFINGILSSFAKDNT